MPRPNGKVAREMDERYEAAVAAGRIQPRRGHDHTVTIKRVAPQPRMSAAERRKRDKPPDYPGYQPREKECRREGCGKKFMAKAPAAAYCSVECRDEAIRAQRLVTDKAKRQRKKERETAERDGKPVTRTCALEGCDREFEPPHPNSRFCSPEHVHEASIRTKARNRAKARGEPPPAEPTSATLQAAAAIEQAERATNGKPVETPEAAEYVTHLWKRVSEDPDCPAHIFDRLERLLGLTPVGSTMPADAAGD